MHQNYFASLLLQHPAYHQILAVHQKMIRETIQVSEAVEAENRFAIHLLVRPLRLHLICDASQRER